MQEHTPIEKLYGVWDTVDKVFVQIHWKSLVYLTEQGAKSACTFAKIDKNRYIVQPLIISRVRNLGAEASK